MPLQYVLPPLPWSLDALSPVISPATMEVHYEKHHKGYLDKVNKLVAGTEKASLTLEEIIRTSSGPLVNAAAQAWNHGFFWKCLTPRKTSPAGGVEAAICGSFESMASFEAKLKAAANELFGSGWVWLVRSASGKLEIVSTPNAGLLVHEPGVLPLLTIDVWEHAYYLDYKNERARYVDGIWTLINWDFVAERLGRFASETG